MAARAMTQAGKCVFANSGARYLKQEFSDGAASFTLGLDEVVPVGEVDLPGLCSLLLPLLPSSVQPNLLGATMLSSS